MVENQIKELIPYLKKRGLRITPQRILILKTIISLKNHPSAEDIHRELPYISLATIYNNIKLFVKLGILNELPYGNGISKFELFKSNHYHVICESCGKIVDFNYPNLKEVEQVASKLTNYHIHNHKLQIYGLCSECKD
ncbi:Fur family transcriptional regulator [Halalkalibacterium ligniniphilum]|uniref:Fur family transcriptional regulator n=1 Tax=Halalkalibacterium ligniniphilum TaxID=1134413 RepID=UPI00034893C5